jgi:hypothetical protein
MQLNQSLSEFKTNTLVFLILLVFFLGGGAFILTPLYPVAFVDFDRSFFDDFDGLIAFSIIEILSERIIQEGRLGFDMPIFYSIERPLLLTETFFGQSIIITILKVFSLNTATSLNFFLAFIPAFNAASFVYFSWRINLTLVSTLIGVLAILFSPLPLRASAHMHVSMFGFFLIMLAIFYDVFIRYRTKHIIPGFLVAAITFYFGGTLLILSFMAFFIILFFLFIFDRISLISFFKLNWRSIFYRSLIGLFFFIFILAPYIYARFLSPELNINRSFKEIASFSIGPADPYLLILQGLFGQLPSLKNLLTPNAAFVFDYGSSAFLLMLFLFPMYFLKNSININNNFVFAVMSTSIVLALLSFGPYLRIGMDVLDIQMPYILFAKAIPFLDLVRGVPRFLVLANALAIILSVILIDCAIKLPKLFPKVLYITIAFFVMYHGVSQAKWKPYYLEDWKRSDPIASYFLDSKILDPVLELPISFSQSYAVRQMLRSAADGYNRFNGVSSNYPSAYIKLANETALCPHWPCFRKIKQIGVQTLAIDLVNHPVKSTSAWVKAAQYGGYDLVELGENFLVFKTADRSPGPTPILLMNNSKNIVSSDLYNNMFVSGWSGAEDWGRWMDGFISQIDLAVDVNNFNSVGIELELEMHGFVVPIQNVVSVDIYSAQKLKKNIIINNNEDSSIKLIIPISHVKQDGLISLIFKAQNTASPFEAGLNDDKRKLSIGLHSITVNPF